MSVIEKISSGVKNMDPLLGGGFPKKSTIAYYGSPGTGKTISSFFFLLEGLKNNEKVLYITFEEGGNDFLSLAESLGVDLKQCINNGLLSIRDFSESSRKDELIQDIVANIKENLISRVVIDSLTTAILDNLTNDSMIYLKKFIRNLTRSLRNLESTVIIVSRDEIEYPTLMGLADCAVYFQPHLMGDDGLSSCNIVKVRLARHNKQMQYLSLSKKGELSINTNS